MVKVLIIAAEDGDDDKYSKFLESLQSKATSALDVWDLEKIQIMQKKIIGRNLNEKLKNTAESSSTLIFISSQELNNFLEGNSKKLKAHSWITDAEHGIISALSKDASKTRIVVSFSPDVKLPADLQNGAKKVFKNFNNADAEINTLISNCWWETCFTVFDFCKQEIYVL